MVEALRDMAKGNASGPDSQIARGDYTILPILS